MLPFIIYHELYNLENFRFQASPGQQMRTALFWCITLWTLLLFCRRFGTTYLQRSSLKMDPISSPETSVRNYHYSLRNNPEECSSFEEISPFLSYYSKSVKSNIFNQLVTFISRLMHSIIQNVDVKIFVL